MKKQIDDWGTGLGADPDRQPEINVPKGNSRSALVYVFRDSMPTEAMDRITATVNAPALMKGFAKLTQRGFTHEQIHAMILAFAKDITRRPLPVEVAPWRAFLANLDKYAKDATKHEDIDSATPSIDPRLSEG